MNKSIKSQFPIFQQQVHGCPFVYLDSAATTHKPLSVIQAMTSFLMQENATVHRGVYSHSQKATQRCEEVRQKVQHFIHANRPEEIIFVKGTTEAINLVAFTLGSFFQTGDEIIISEMEHHANFVPWQQLCLQKKLTLHVIPLTPTGELDLTVFETLLSHRTKLVAITHVSNVLGTLNPIDLIIQKSHEKGALVLIDGAQAIAHYPVNVDHLNCDFYCFSGHKLYGPTGIGVLYGKYDLLNQLPPYQTGGGMIKQVSLEKVTFADLPSKFEPGTPAVVEIIGLGAAIDFMNTIGFSAIKRHEEDLLVLLKQSLSHLSGLQILGTPFHQSAIVSFNMDSIHPHDVGTFLDEQGIAIRVGHHCAQPLMKRFGLSATARASLGLYNDEDDIHAFIKALKRVQEYFS